MSNSTERWLTLALLIALLLIVSAGLGAAPLLRWLLITPLVLLAPGMAMVQVFLPSVSLPSEGRLLLALALGLAALILSGLILHWLPVGISPLAQPLLLTGMTLPGLLIWFKRQRAAGCPILPSLTLPFSWHQTFLLCSAVLVVVLAFTIARHPTPPSGSEGYTILSVTPAASAGDGALKLTVQSMELGATEYRLALRVDGREATEWTRIALSPGEKWEVTVPVIGDVAAGKMVEGILYRLGAPDTIYRHVRFWPDFEETS